MVGCCSNQCNRKVLHEWKDRAYLREQFHAQDNQMKISTVMVDIEKAAKVRLENAQNYRPLHVCVPVPTDVAAENKRLGKADTDGVFHVCAKAYKLIYANRYIYTKARNASGNIDKAFDAVHDTGIGKMKDRSSPVSGGVGYMRSRLNAFIIYMP